MRPSVLISLMIAAGLAVGVAAAVLRLTYPRSSPAAPVMLGLSQPGDVPACMAGGKTWPARQEQDGFVCELKDEP